jgi:hypothetical protein
MFWMNVMSPSSESNSLWNLAACEGFVGLLFGEGDQSSMFSDEILPDLTAPHPKKHSQT